MLQESLTNTLRHAGLVNTHLRLAVGADSVTVEVTNEGACPSHSRVKRRVLFPPLGEIGCGVATSAARCGPLVAAEPKASP